MPRIATSLPYTELEVATGNFDTSRVAIDRVVIHTMVGAWQGAASRFDTYGQQVSAHYGVKLDGGLIHWLEETSTAYHSGSYSMNQRSIGIEHEDGGNYNGVRPDILYESSAKLVHDICSFYNIPLDRTHIIKHSEVIPTGCPDALDIDRIVRQAAALNTPPINPLAECLRQHDQLVTQGNQKDQQISDLNQKLTAMQSDFDNYKKSHPTSTTIVYPLPSGSTVSDGSPIVTGSTATPPSATLPPVNNIPANQPEMISYTSIFRWIKSIFHKK